MFKFYTRSGIRVRIKAGTDPIAQFRKQAINFSDDDWFDCFAGFSAIYEQEKMSGSHDNIVVDCLARTSCTTFAEILEFGRKLLNVEGE